MADRTNGNQEPGYAKGSRGIAARLADDAARSKKGSQRGLASPKPGGDNAKNFVANGGKNQTLSPSPAIASRTINVPWDHVPLHAEVTRTRLDQRNDSSRGAINGNKQGLASPKPGGDKIANKAITNKKMDDRVKNWETLNTEGRDALRARWEQKRAYGKPPPKRGDVKKAIAEAGVKKVIDTGKAFCCAPGPFDVDEFVRDLPFPTRNEPTATLWDKVGV